MNISDQLMKQIDETKYLSTENTWRYRPIIRYFYEEYNRIKYWLYKEEVFEVVKKNKMFKDYTIEQCRQDLDALVQWKNLNAIQDTSKAGTIEEFKNKQFRYQLTEYSIEIERMIVKLENLLVEGASLEPSLLEKLKNELSRFKEMTGKDSKEVGQWWNDINADFKRLNHNYQDYIRIWQSMKAEEMMKTKSFLLYKDQLIHYLRDFIKGLSQYVQIIERILIEIPLEDQKIVLNKVLIYEQSIPRLEQQTIEEDYIKSVISGRWTSLKEWFLGNNERISESEKLFDMTNEIIRKITRYASQISESTNQGANRKEEYRKLATMFLNSDNLDNMGKLSSVVFGIERPKKLKYEIKRATESINSSVFEEEPYEVTIKPRVRTYREKANRTGIKEYKTEKEAMRKKIIEKAKLEKELLNKYIKDGQLLFEELQDIEPFIRKTTLRWLTKSLLNSEYKGKTETGRSFILINPKENKKCTINCKDGKMVMPAYVLKFEKE